MTKDFCVISFYTENSLYEKDVRDLVASCQKFKIPYIIEKVPNLGSWEKNCCFKPKYILEKLQALKKAVVWVDADAILVQKPKIFPLACDIAAYKRQINRKEKKVEMIQSGTLFVNYTKKAMELLKKWEKACQKKLKEEEKKKKPKEVWDQECLNDLLKKEKSVIFEKLPLGYCRVFDYQYEEISMEETFILHFQASRFTKPLVGNSDEISFLQNIDSIDLKFMRFHIPDTI
jgi:hypothetical protein